MPVASSSTKNTSLLNHNKLLLSDPPIISTIKSNDPQALLSALNHQGDDLLNSRDFFNWTPLHYAAYHSNPTAITELLQRGALVNAKDNFQTTPLSLAAIRGNAQIIQLLLASGADVNLGFPLHRACEYGHVKCARLLLEKGASVSLEDQHGKLAIILASKAECLEIIRILVQYSSDINAEDKTKDTPLFWACFNGNPEVIRGIVQLGADVNHVNQHGQTPLSMVLLHFEPNIELTQLLIDLGADVNYHEGFCLESAIHFTYDPKVFRLIAERTQDLNWGNIDKETPLYIFARAGKYDLVEILLERGADANIASYGGWVPLHIAAAEGHLATVEALLKNGANPNVVGSNNLTPLHLAVLHEHTEVVKKLLEHKAVFDVPIINVDYIDRLGLPGFINDEDEKVWDNSTALDLAMSKPLIRKLLLGAPKKPHQDLLLGWSPLHHAAYSGDKSQLIEALKGDLDVNQEDICARTALSIAADRNHPEILEVLLENHADANRGSPLIYAANKNNVHCVSVLISKAADLDLNLRNRFDRTALQLATIQNRTEAAVELINHKADVNIPDDLKDTPLHNAALSGNLQLVSKLLSHGALLDSENKHHKESPLLYAAMEGHGEVVEVLLSSGAMVDHPDNTLSTPLHYAVEYNHHQVVLLLLKHGADVHKRNSEGKTVLHFLSDDNPKETLEVLLGHGAKVNAVDNHGLTPLHVASWEGHSKLAELLLENHAEVNATSAAHVTPLFLAVATGRVALVRILLQHGALVNISLAVAPGIYNIDCQRYKFLRKPLGRTPLLMAAHQGRLEVVQEILKRDVGGEFLEHCNELGDGVLREAVLNGNKEMVRLIKEKSEEGNKLPLGKIVIKD